jgi:hypothetical protein
MCLGVMVGMLLFLHLLAPLAGFGGVVRAAVRITNKCMFLLKWHCALIRGLPYSLCLDSF